MLFHHSFVVVCGDDCQALRQQVVVGMAGFHLDNLPLLADMVDILSEQQLNATMFSLGSRLNFLARRGC